MASYIYSPYEALIWKLLFNEFHNAFAVAGIMGWMVGESGLYPYRCEIDYTANKLVNDTLKLIAESVLLVRERPELTHLIFKSMDLKQGV